MRKIKAIKTDLASLEDDRRRSDTELARTETQLEAVIGERDALIAAGRLDDADRLAVVNAKRELVESSITAQQATASDITTSITDTRLELDETLFAESEATFERRRAELLVELAESLELIGGAFQDAVADRTRAHKEHGRGVRINWGLTSFPGVQIRHLSEKVGGIQRQDIRTASPASRT